MIKKNLKLLLITSVIVLLPILVGLVLWNQLPDQLPFHWNAAGEVDGWASKPVAVFGAPLMMLACQWLCVVVTAADPKKANHPGKILHLVFWIIPVLSAMISAAIYATALGKTVRIELLTPVLLGVLFVIIGNYLPKCKQNYTIGIKIPWTLHSEENWNKTHRFAGMLWVICGFAMMITGFFGVFWFILPITLVMVIPPFLYSYLLYRKGM